MELGDRDKISRWGLHDKGPTDRLCSQCAALQLSLDDFIPGTSPVNGSGRKNRPGGSATSWQQGPFKAHPSAFRRNFGRTSAPEASSYLQLISDEVPPHSASFTPHTGPRLLESLPMIYQKRRSCSFCWLLYMATRAPGLGRPSGYDNMANLPCAVEWRLDGRFVGAGSTTRRLRVFDPNGQYPDAFIMPLEHSVETSQEKDQNTRPSFLARRIPRTTVDIDLIKRWLDICTRHHGGGCASTSQQADRPGNQGWIRKFRFIDVHERRLVEAEDLLHLSPEQAQLQYVTVSYCWGEMLGMKLLKDCLQEYKVNLPADSPRMPRTLRDAIELVRALGQRYVWIDSLCIVQDDPDEWSAVAPLMGRLYEVGLFNICAAAGSSASHGIPGSPSTPRLAVQSEARCFGMDLMVVRPVESEIDSTAWNARAWTFQERILSRRCLVFLQDRVHFQCRQITWSEEVNGECGAATWNLGMVKSPVHSFDNKVPVLHFAEYVSLYSARKLTFLSDRLVAFNGLAGALSSRLQSDFVFGLPLAYFDWALLWEIYSNSDRIDIGVGKFPSWSWCGWNGPSGWRTSTTSGTLENLHEWLTEHTWIKWNINESNLAPAGLWSGGDSPQSHKSSPRWAGYGLQWSQGRSDMNPGGSIAHGGLRPELEISQAPDVLHFWSWTAFFRLASVNLPETPKTDLGNGLRRFSIVDNKDDWCGTIVLDQKFQQLADENATLEFVAISDAKRFEGEELSSWSYYIPEERGLAEWYLYYSMLVKWDTKRKVAERVGLGKIYKAAFAEASWDPGMKWREIRLR